MMKKIIAGLLLMSVACVVQAAVSELEFNYEPLSGIELSSLREEANLKNASCSFSIGEVIDARQNKETVGFAVSKSVNAQSVDKWLSSAATSFFPKNLESNGDQLIVATPKLVRLYSYPESMNILGVTALKVDFSREGNTLLTKNYRGFYAKTNWANGDSEYLTALNYSINDLMKKLVRDLGPVCQQISSGEYLSVKIPKSVVTESKPVVANNPKTKKEQAKIERSEVPIEKTKADNRGVSKPASTELSYVAPEPRKISKPYTRPVQKRVARPERKSNEKVIDAVACEEQYSYMFAICQ